MKKINSQEDLNQLINLLDWPHAFLRECYLLSPSYVCPEDRGLVAPDIVPTIKALICTQEIECPGRPCSVSLSKAVSSTEHFIG